MAFDLRSLVLHPVASAPVTTPALGRGRVTPVAVPAVATLRAPAVLLAALLLTPAGGCGDDSGETGGNVITDGSGGSSSDTANETTTTSGTTASATTASGSGASATDTTTAATDTDAVLPPAPATFRFDCIDIQQLGSEDGTVFQATTLENTWGNDIRLNKLNIMVDYLTQDEASGTGTMQIRSGIPDDSAAGYCADPGTISSVVDVTFEPGVSKFGPDDTQGACSQELGMSGPAATGTYRYVLPTDEVVYIYAQDTPENGNVAFNCTPDDAVPDAVPLRGIEAEFTVTADNTYASGNLLGCLVEREAEGLCSCLGQCTGNPPMGNCAGCPNGALPLRTLLGTQIMPTQRCSDLLGEPAFDLRIGFTAARLGDIPATCGG
jgi:hypothetical protein